MQFLIIRVQQQKNPSYIAYKVNLDDGNFIDAAIVSPEAKRHCRYAADKSYLLSQFASQIMCQLQKAYTPSCTGNYPLLLAHTLGIF